MTDRQITHMAAQYLNGELNYNDIVLNLDKEEYQYFCDLITISKGVKK